MSLDVAIETAHALFATSPMHGRAVTFEVQLREVNVARDKRWGRRIVAERYVVALKGSDGAGFSSHISFERACGAALSRARRYDRAYSVPRGVAA